MSSAFSASISGAGRTEVMPPPRRAERSRCEPPVRRVAMDPDSRARLEPKAADARLLEAAERVEISGPTPPVAAEAADPPVGSAAAADEGAAYPATPSLVGGRAADVAVARVDRAGAPGLLAGAALGDGRTGRRSRGRGSRGRRAAGSGRRTDGGRRGGPGGHAAHVAVAVDDRSGAARLRAVHGRGLWGRGADGRGAARPARGCGRVAAST